MAAFLTAVNGATSVTVCVYSAAASTLQEVTEIKVGNVFDTQRRRRNDLVESYASAAV